LHPALNIFGSAAAKHLRPATALPQTLVRPAWGLACIAGRLAELCGTGASAVLTVGLGLVRSAQEVCETAVWVTSPESLFSPVDAVEGGVDLEALAVVRVPGATALLRVADKLVHSGAFGVIILDVVPLLSPFSVSLAQQSRLLSLAQKHQTAIVFLTSQDRPLSVAGSLISLRGQVGRRCVGTDLHEVEVRILKDKQCGPGWHHAELCCGPNGLC